MKLSNIKLEWVAILGCLIYILFLQECKIGKKIFGDNSVTVDTLLHTIDTLTITHIDTIQLPPVIKYVTLEIPIPTYIHDTVWKDGVMVVDTLAKYETIVNDSLLEGVIRSSVNGILVTQDFIYTAKFPKYIIRTDTVKITENTVLDKKKLFLYVGGEFGGSASQINLSPIIGIGTKKGYMYSYRYGLVDKTHNISFSKKLSFNLKR